MKVKAIATVLAFSAFLIATATTPTASARRDWSENDVNVYVDAATNDGDITARVSLDTGNGYVNCYIDGMNILDEIEHLHEGISEVNEHTKMNNVYIQKVDGVLFMTNKRIDNLRKDFAQYTKERAEWENNTENFMKVNRNMIVINDNEIKKNYDRIVDIHNSMQSFVENTYNEFVVWTEDSIQVLGRRTDKNHRDVVELQYWRDGFAENYRRFKDRYWEFKKEQGKLWEESYDFRGRTHARFDKQRDNLIAMEYQHEDLERQFELSEDEEESHEAGQREEFNRVNEDIERLGQRTIFIILAVVCLVAIILIQMAYTRQERERQEKRIESLERIIVNEQENE